MDTTTSKTSYCRFCLSFCGIKIDFDADGQPVRVLGDPQHPVSKGYTCQKGRSLIQFYARNRLLQPMRFGQEVMDWDTALSRLGQTIAQAVQTHGPDAVALYAGTNATLDAAGMWTALGFMYRLKSNNIYTVATVDAVNKQLALEAMSAGAILGLIPHIDFDGADCVLLVGANPIVSHGHLAGLPYPGKHLHDLVRRGGQLLVADPRESKSAKKATLHLRPRPGTDFAWLGHVLRELLADPDGGGLDAGFIQHHTSELEALRQTVARFDLPSTTRLTGLDAQALGAMVAAVKRARHFAAASGTGLSFGDAGVVGEWLLWALLALKGGVDRPGGVWFNPGYVRPAPPVQASPAAAREGSAWNLPMPARPDLMARAGERPCAGLADEILAGHVRVLICIGGNPVNAFPNREKTMAALAKLDAFVVLDTHRNDLVGLAHYGLPVSGQLERVDSSIYAQNSAPAIAVQFTGKVLEPPPQVKPAWWVFSRLGEQLGLDTVKLGKPTAELDDIAVLKTIKGARELFENSRLMEDGHVLEPEMQFGWVTATMLPEGRWRLHSTRLETELARVLDGLAATGGAIGGATGGMTGGAVGGAVGGAAGGAARESAPLLLVSMREDDHLNTQFMLEQGESQHPVALLHLDDARGPGLEDGDLATVANAHGAMRVRVAVSPHALAGTVSVPHGFKDFGNVSCLTSAETAFNPLSGMAAQTALPVTLSKLPSPA